MSAAEIAIACRLLDDVAPYWQNVVRSASTLALFLDFDGTLAPIVERPELACIDPQIKNILERLKSVEGVKLALVSGRRLADLRARAGIDGIFYAGNHGYEIESDTVCFREPRAEGLRLELRRLVLRLEQQLADATGIEFEEKGLSAAVHYRQVHPSLHDWIRRGVADAVRRSGMFSCLEGKMVVDVRPAIPWNKGYAVEWILERMLPPETTAVYVGDDTTDEDAFQALGADALTIRVGYSVSSHARFWVPDVAAVRSFLSAIWELRSAMPKRHTI